jgi:TRAP transporter, 4TM/12TM fusion protein
MDNKNNEAVDGVVASEEISLEEQQAVLEKFDQESNTRNVTGFAKGFIKWYAIAMAVFHVYTSFFGLWATIRQRAMHLLFVMPLCYLMYPAKKGGARNNPSLLDWVFAALSFVCCGYIVVNYDAIFLRGGLPNQMDIIMGCLCALLVLEAVRRVVGIVKQEVPARHHKWLHTSLRQIVR